MRFVFCFVSVFLLVSCVHAESYGNVVFLRLDVYESDAVELVDLYVDKGVPMVFLDGEADYSLVVFDADRERVYAAPLDVGFVFEIEVDTGGFSYETNSTRVFLRVPYYDNAERMVLYHGDDIIYELNLKKELCDMDGLCDARENHLSCPSDCGAGEGVSYCDTSADGVCDVDCFPEWDPDCVASTAYQGREETAVTSTVPYIVAVSTTSLFQAQRAEGSGSDYLFYAGIAVAAVVLLFVIKRKFCR